MKKVWLISGFGLDERAFQFLDHFGWKLQYVHWVRPDKNDTLKEYARKLLAQITEENPLIIGYSLGGMLAIEIAQLIETDKIILISSAKTRSELPAYFRWGAYVPLYRLISPALMKNRTLHRLWLKRVAPNIRNLLYAMLKNADANYLKWGMKAIVHWQNSIVPENVCHIHGTADRILPYYYVHPDFPIKGGSHLMIMDRAKEISATLRQIIDGADNK